MLQAATDPLYLDITMAPGAEYRQPVRAAHSAFMTVVEGEVAVRGPGAQRSMVPGTVGVLGAGEVVTLKSSQQGGRLLLCAGRPLGEPVARAGPFVMNSEAELHQAFRDFRDGTLG